MPRTTTRRAPNNFAHRSLKKRGFALALISLLAPLAAAPAAAEDVNRIVLRVNNEILTLHDYEKRKAGLVSSVLASPDLSPTERQERLAEVGKEVMLNVFNELLLLSYASQHRIRVTDAEVDEAVQELRREQGLENDEEMQSALASTGMTIERLRDNMRNDLIWRQVMGREVHSKIDVGEEELRAYYRNHPELFRVPEKRQLKEVIVLESSGLDGEQLRQKAEEIHAQLASGAEPQSVIETHRESGLTSGLIDLGWLEAEELEPVLAEAAWELVPGEYSPPVRGRGGFHILYLGGIEESTVLPFDDVQNRILARERNRRFAEELRKFLADLEAKAHVVENLPPDAVGYRSFAGLENEDELELFRQPLVPVAEDEDSAAEVDDAAQVTDES